MKLARVYKAKYGEVVSLDWESVAAVGLCEAASRFEEERGICFWTLAYHRVRGAFFDAMRSERLRGYGRGRYEGKPDVFSLDSKLPWDKRDSEGRAVSSHALIPDGTLPVGWEERSVDEVYGLTRSLPEKARETVRLYYCHGLTMLQIARRLGLSESRVSQLHSDAIAYLRETLTPERITA